MSDPAPPRGVRQNHWCTGDGLCDYEWILKNHPGQWMYEQPSWLLTHRPHIVAEGHPVQVFDGDVADLHPKLVSAAAGKDVWVVGGGETAAQFSSVGLIDEIIVTYAPCSLVAGSRLLPIRSEWALVESGSTATSSAPGGGRPSW